MNKILGKVRHDLRTVGDTLKPNEDSFVRQRDLAVLAGYLVFSAACAAPLAYPDVSRLLQIVLGVALLLSFLGLARLTVLRLRTLGEFEQLILYRSMATGGLIAVWFVLATGVVAVASGFDNLFLFVALGPPEFWLCTAIFARALENAYRMPAPDDS